jgi:cytochrome bd-type quinol oxidase subunit 1
LSGESPPGPAEISIPVLGSLIASVSFDSKEVLLTSFPRQYRPPVLIPFFAFRMVFGCGLLMLAMAWFGSYLYRADLRKGGASLSSRIAPRVAAEQTQFQEWDLGSGAVTELLTIVLVRSAV